jgi:hypothetical protein
MPDPISGAVSALMSVLNFGNTIGRQHAKLKVTPNVVVSPPYGVMVEVVNLSPFEVEITEIGINRRDGRRHSLLGAPLTNGQTLPYRLQSRSSVSAYFTAHDIDINAATTAFARTSCGILQKGDSAAWKDLREFRPEGAGSSCR